MVRLTAPSKFPAKGRNPPTQLSRTHLKRRQPRERGGRRPGLFRGAGARARYNPRAPGRLAQLGEHQLDKLGVAGSSPAPPIGEDVGDLAGKFHQIVVERLRRGCLPDALQRCAAHPLARTRRPQSGDRTTRDGDGELFPGFSSPQKTAGSITWPRASALRRIRLSRVSAISARVSMSALAAVNGVLMWGAPGRPTGADGLIALGGAVSPGVTLTKALRSALRACELVAPPVAYPCQPVRTVRAATFRPRTYHVNVVRFASPRIFTVSSSSADEFQL